ncbi:hypothetical protein C482_13615 [Natrialba chahannaoensis JCM 10990]|uniref:Uncharacterized protein n=1 Tax=Natrialba chahannaoensis JCM 10990 TaxID=1227492 RepID=M0AEU2_9EURY|nr:hypothetical protein [Natrialba chahannaoensis]ELY97275.1 hypothetical protein C482_13615 [Natrialba chahannaoensis JCM 10990]
MRVVNVLDTGIFRGIGKPPSAAYDDLETIITDHTVEIQLPRPIYAELGGDPTADQQPSGSDYVDQAIRDGWIDIAAPVADSEPVDAAVQDARHVMESAITHGKTAVFAEDLSLIGVTINCSNARKAFT